MEEIVHHYPGGCGACGREFEEQERTPGERFGRHQVAELPPISVLYFEHRTHHLPCPGCGKHTAGKLPEEVAGSPFGVGVHAAMVTLTARNRVSRRDMPELAQELFGLSMSSGAVDAICQRASAALEDPHDALAEKVLSSPAVNVDETGWYTAHEQRTMWTVSTPEAAIFRICEDRHRDRLQELIGKNFEGIVGSDRWWAYELFDPESRQAAPITAARCSRLGVTSARVGRRRGLRPQSPQAATLRSAPISIEVGDAADGHRCRQRVVLADRREAARIAACLLDRPDLQIAWLSR